MDEGKDHGVEPPLAVKGGEGQGPEAASLLQGDQVQDHQEAGLGPFFPGPVPLAVVLEKQEEQGFEGFPEVLAKGPGWPGGGTGPWGAWYPSSDGKPAAPFK